MCERKSTASIFRDRHIVQCEHTLILSVFMTTKALYLHLLHNELLRKWHNTTQVCLFKGLRSHSEPFILQGRLSTFLSPLPNKTAPSKPCIFSEDMWYLQEASMSLNNVPSKAEVMGWNPQSLADYMKRVSSKRATSHYKTFWYLL